MKTNFQKKARCLFVFLSLVCVFSSCKDDDGNGPAFDSKGKRLVKEIIWTSVDDSEKFTFSYNGEGQLTRLAISSMEGEEYEDITTFSVKNNILTAKWDLKDEDEPETSVGTFILNEDGYVVSGTEVEDYDRKDTLKYTCEYDTDRFLTKMSEKKSDRISTDYYTHNAQGDYTKATRGSYTYYEDKENKANIDFYEIHDSVLGNDSFYLGLAGYLGKTNKHLVKSTSGSGGSTITYKFDDEGYVIEFIVKDYGEDEVYKVSYN